MGDGIAQIGDGIHGTPSYVEDGDVFFINGNNLVNGKIVISQETKSVDESQLTNTEKSLNGNTILMSINGTIGNLAWYHGEKVMLGKSTAYLKVSDFNKEFIYTLLQTEKTSNYFKSNLTGTTIKNLGLKTIRETPALIPTSLEQKKIGIFFNSIEDIITLHQRKLEQLKELKKAYLQLMFPTKEERVPKLRFADFEGEWELCKLIGILDIIKGTQKSKSELSTNQNNCTPYPVYNGGINPSGYTNIYNRENAITISEGGNSAGFVNFVQEKFFSGGHNYTIVNNVTDTLFLFFYLCSIQEEIMRLRVGSGLPNIQKPTLMNLEIQKTTDNEQKFIGLFLKNIDILITLTQNKLNQLKSLKKSYLQNMFI
ncbi:Restriction endonuclease S subunits [Enterococcus faecalis]|uniref:restriction endonuclease subunit S n=1 Tax=Enterococcus faecalis TaxID=1351 RepID=UPI001026D1C8|nr:restriction endonuclease subunit S [Enterococcus faecalis]VFA75369.1 Restriction endonuclease S subunits [Enterococcus faecalis]